ncbi:ribokinase [Dickeya dadantii]|uniref:Ribokinase n=2 Tax=Dickeya dadantii TaxID=204038 RepID=E0SJU5_DICD3|nr:ribokinase [Dickeya dadantii]ADN00384.1 Ribokinase [Dickeya dadantii 3937]NAT79647.1 ribokinase [Dickeya dadantii]NPE53255.1 ribokinase [Dickeya dadantii]NPE54280.1 ribokinase [Dickeya dadantii]NPE61279.1 ribokinase [Dickeya dadantii]
MFLEERRNKILEYLDQYDRASVEYLAAIFSVTRETIRSDLNALARQRLVQRCHGGAVIIRRSLQSQLITETGKDFEVLLKKIKNQVRNKSVRKKDKTMKGKVCILGSFNVDIVARVARFPKGGESLLAQGSALGPGGKGANQAMAASMAGAKVHFVSKVGKDQFSHFAYEHLSKSAIHSFKLYQSDTEPTGNAIIYVSLQNGENMIAIYSGANKTLTDEEIAEIMPELEDADVLLLQMENNFPATLSAMKLARALDTQIILNPAPYSDDVLSCLDYVDIITPNETEASLLSGIEINNLDSARQAAQKIHALGAARVIITMGANGALLFDGQQFQHIPAFPAVSVDTTGAGDAFNGAFAAAVAGGQSVAQAATYANAFASLAVEREGAANMPTQQQVTNRLAQR